MSKKIMQELNKLTTAELQRRLNDLTKELFKLRFEKITGKLENYSRIRQTKRNIARVLTLLNERGKG